MLRATSEMAVAIRVRSVLENPSTDESRRPSWRAVTMSSSVAMRTRPSSVARLTGLLRDPVEELEPLLEVERRVDALEVQPQLHHCESHLQLDAHHHRPRAAQISHRSDQVVALLENRDGHSPLPGLSGSPPPLPLPSSPRSRAGAPPARCPPGDRRPRSSCSGPHRS